MSVNPGFIGGRASLAPAPAVYGPAPSAPSTACLPMRMSGPHALLAIAAAVLIVAALNVLLARYHLLAPELIG